MEKFGGAGVMKEADGLREWENMTFSWKMDGERHGSKDWGLDGNGRQTTAVVAGWLKVWGKSLNLIEPGVSMG